MNSVVSFPALALDTSGSFCSAALRTAGGSVLHRESSGAGDHFEVITSLVSELLSAGGVKVSELGQICVGVGPGSFTGLRIGMSFAKGMAVAGQVPLVGVSSFAGIAEGALHARGLPDSTRILVIADARRDEVFLAEYVESARSVKELRSPCIVPVSEVADWVARYADGVVVTPNAGFSVGGVEKVSVEARIAEGLLARAASQKGHFSLTELAELEPNYLRAVAAKSIEERKGP